MLYEINMMKLAMPRSGQADWTDDWTPSSQSSSYDDRLHRALNSFNRERFAPGMPTGLWEQELDRMMQMQQLEEVFLQGARREISGKAASAPTDPDEFISWFEALKDNGPGQNDPLFPWLERSAPLPSMRWFLTQEIAGEAGFDDLVALTQVKMPGQAKMELARNYWDEMGRGNPKGLHGGMLEKLADALFLKPNVETTVWEALALANTMAGLAANRRYAYHSIGALGVIELTSPGRSAQVAQGLKRLGIPAEDRHYFDLHAVLDVKHSKSWNEEVIKPLVSSDPTIARAIAEGALMRLICGQRCFERYRSELGFQAQAPAA